MFRRISIRRKLILVSMLASTVALVLASLASISYDMITARRAMVRDLTVEAEIVGANSASAILFDDPYAATETLSALRAEPHVLSAGIYTTGGELFSAYRRPDQAGVSLPEAGEVRGDGHAFGPTDLTIFRSVHLDGDLLGFVYIQSDLRALQSRLAGGITIAVLVLGASGLVAYLIAAQLQRVISDPILHLVETARNISDENNYSVRATATTEDELGLLVKSFNDMLERIQERDSELQEAHDQLEDRVENRTRQLRIEIAERTRTQEQLKTSAAKLERANRELQDFMRVAAHDLQEPLRKVRAFGDRLSTRFEAALSDRGRDYIIRMQNAAGRMQTLIDDLRAFSSVASGERPFVRVDLGVVTREVLEDLKQEIDESGGRVEIGDLPVIEADLIHIRQLMRQLIDNGLRYQDAKRAPEVRVTAELVPGNGAESCRLSVEDNGIGFDEKYLDRIFVVFQRLHGREEYGGTGVGLAICRKIVERHGGTITATSRVGEGSRFLVTLPIAHSDPAPVLDLEEAA